MPALFRFVLSRAGGGPITSQGATSLVEIPETRYAKTLDGGYCRPALSACLRGGQATRAGGRNLKGEGVSALL
jgi:hypothetical protein